MGPHYNKIILVYKNDTPFLAQYVTTFRKIASKKVTLFLLIFAMKMSHCKALKLCLK